MEWSARPTLFFIRVFISIPPSLSGICRYFIVCNLHVFFFVFPLSFGTPQDYIFSAPEFIFRIGTPTRERNHMETVDMDLEGKGELLLTLARNHATPEQWAAWLRVPLGGAAAVGDVAMIECLLAAGADAGAGQREPDGATLLHAAAEGGRKRIVQAFVAAGCGPDVDCTERTGGKLSALHVAAEEGHSRAAGALIRAGATVDLPDGNGHGRTALHCAALHGHDNVVIDLLLNGADKEAEDDEGSRPLHLAVEGGHKEVLKLLLRAGASPDCEMRRTGRRPLYMAALGGHHKIMRELIEKGADKDARINRGRGRSGNFTALHAAAELGGVEAINVLVSCGADLEAPSEHMSTPLHLAASGGAVDAVITLLAAGADVEARDSAGSTPLHNGCKFLRTAVVRALLDWNANTSAVDNLGRSIQDMVGTRIPDGKGGKGERTEVIVDMLGLVPPAKVISLPTPIIAPPTPSTCRPLKTPLRASAPSPLGSLFSFPKVSAMFRCTATKEGML